MKLDYIEKIDGAERRYAQPNKVEVRAEGTDIFFEGYGATFGDVADLGWMSEEIDPLAFSEVMGDDVRGLFNHDDDQVLGRTASGTMTWTIDKTGAKYSIRYNPNDPDHVRVMEKVKRGDVSQSSFAFSVKDDRWETRNGKEHRTVLRIKRLYDFSPVTYPAYQNTTVAKRSYETTHPDNTKDLAEMDLDAMKRDLVKNKIIKQ